MRILVVRPGALGDLILTLPAIKRIRDDFSTAHIAVWGTERFLSIIHNRFYADEILSIDSRRLAPLFVESDSMAQSQQLKEVARFDRAYVWMANPDDVFVRNLKRLVPNLVSASSIQTKPEIHQSEFLYKIHESIRCEPPRIFPVALDIEAAHRILKFDQPRKRIAIHPGAGSMEKRWPLDRFLQVAMTLVGWGYHVFWITGPSEDFAPPPPEIQNLSHLDLPVLAALLSKMELFIGNDSGVSHLAAAAGSPVISIFGPTNPIVWKPRGMVLQSAGGAPGVSVQDVLDLITSTLVMNSA